MTALGAILPLLMASMLAYGADNGSPSSREALYTAFGHPNESARVSGSNDIYRAKIRDRPVAATRQRLAEPVEVFGRAGYYLYDLDAWAMVSSGPIIGPYRSRTYSLFGSDLNGAALNPLTMRSEGQRRSASPASGSRPSWSYPGWRF
jgi:hypothetical protein